MPRYPIPYIVLLTLILGCGTSEQSEPPPPPVPSSPAAPPAVAPVAAPAPSPNAPAPPGTVPAITFANERYVLAHRAADASTAINEYIPVGERIEHFTKMIAVRRYGDQSDPRAAAQRVATRMQAQTPPRPHEIIPLPDGRVMIYFTTWAGPITEFNLQIFQVDPGGRGLRELQYAERSYTEDPRRFIERMSPQRARLQSLLIGFSAPTLLE